MTVSKYTSYYIVKRQEANTKNDRVLTSNKKINVVERLQISKQESYKWINSI